MSEGAVETRTYEVVFIDGKRQRITIPATWKVTFGAIVPASAKAAAQAYQGSGFGSPKTSRPRLGTANMLPAEDDDEVEAPF